MPKQVDHRQRRELIADALMRVAARDGLEAVSLRNVGAEAGVTAGMVQHYFASKGAMLDFAMATASARFEARMTAAVTSLGEDPAPRELIGAVLMTLLPTCAGDEEDARVALAFLSYAAHQRARSSAEGSLDDSTLHASNAQLCDFLAEQIRAAQRAGGGYAGIDPAAASTGLFAMAEGLAVHVIAAGLPSADAAAALPRNWT